MQKAIRLSKRLANEGVCSRREAEYLIDQGWIKVNGETIQEQGVKVVDTDLVEVLPQAYAHLDRKMTLVLHKPVGYVSHASEDKYPHVFDLITAENCHEETATRIKIEGMAPVGRLDIDSKGLLVLSQDGRIAKAIIGENTKVKKKYVVKLNKPLSSTELKILKQGNAWEETGILKPVDVKEIGDCLYEIRLIEGKNRQIRRMMQSLHKEVHMLKRVAIGAIRLADLPEGQWRLLRDDEKASILDTLEG